jgi:hypothetical protein
MEYNIYNVNVIYGCLINYYKTPFIYIITVLDKVEEKSVSETEKLIFGLSVYAFLTDFFVHK